ncbi:MAG TPA: hypothetical protein VGL02_02355 [Streptomyces sp.]|jgi:hypothetical protein
MNTTTRHTIAAALAAAALAVVPAVAAAGDGSAKPMSSAQIYALTCGHLGVPCDPPHARHHARSRHARGARHHRARH